jgi:hypothetical protein
MARRQFNCDVEILGNLLLAEGTTLVLAPGSSVTPTENGELVIEATSNTLLTFKLKGSDGIVRSGTLTLGNPTWDAWGSAPAA